MWFVGNKVKTDSVREAGIYREAGRQVGTQVDFILTVISLELSVKVMFLIVQQIPINLMFLNFPVNWNYRNCGSMEANMFHQNLNTELFNAEKVSGIFAS